MKKSINYKINLLIIGSVVLITVMLLGMSIYVVNRFSHSMSNTILGNAVEIKEIELNSQQKNIEQSVKSIYEISKYAIDDYSKLNSHDNIEAYLDKFMDTSIGIANNTDGCMALYFRINPQIAGNGKQGFFCQRGGREEDFNRIANTDILAYDEDDIEHVGWYYEPIKHKKAMWMNPYYNANIDVEMISYIIPIFDGDTPIGVVGMDVDFDLMLNVVESLDIYKNCGANLINPETGKVFYKKDSLLGDDIDDEIYASISDTKSSEMIPISINNDKYKMHYTTINNGMKLVVYAKNSDIYRADMTIIMIGTVLFFLIFVLTIFIAIHISNRITKPIAQINEAAKEFANGNWDVEISCDTNDELEELTNNIINMAQATKSNIAYLNEALLVAQEASNAKTTFLSNVSHDIRTPMNAIMSYSQFAASQPDLSQKTHSYLMHIMRASEHLLSLINSVLEMSRIESGKFQLNIINCNIRELIEELEHFVYANATEKNQSVAIDVSGIKHEHIMCDSLRFNQVMINLVGNAIKFTEDGGKIFITAYEDDRCNSKESMYHFSVRDTGMGIDEEFIDSIFNPFERESNSTVSGIQGTGLGLAISKNFVEMMGGSISVKSKKGKGTEFFIDILFTLADTDNEIYTASQETNLTDSQDIDMSNLNILLVEDNKVNRLIAKEILGKKVALMDEAVNGIECLEMIESHAPGYYSLILMDVQMPKMDGYEATKSIRAMENKQISDIPIIAMTANAFEEDRRNALNAGMNAHVAKPIDVDILMNTIKGLI